MPETIDYLNDELLLTPAEKPKAAQTSLLARAVEVIERINAFMAETGAEPISQPGRSVRERMLANELAGLRASKADLEGLAPYDTRNLVFGGVSVTDPLDDPLLSDGLDIFEVRDELKPIARPDFVADRRPCPDFERFEPLFEGIRQSVEEGTRKPQPFRQERVELARISHTTECIGAANQRKPLCRNNSSLIRGAPRCRQSVAWISLDLNL